MSLRPGTITLPSVETPGWLRKRATPKLLVAFGLVWLSVFFILPVVLLLFQSLNFAEGGLFEYYVNAFSGTFADTLTRTLWYALLTTVVCVALGYVVAYYIVFKARRKVLLLSAVLLPLWIAIILRYFGVSLFLLPTGPLQLVFGTDFGLLFSTPGVILGLVCALLPLAIIPIYNSLRSIDEALIDASRILGATPFQTFRRVVGPQSLSGVIAGSLFVYILAAGSFLAPAILGGPGNFMMANVIEQAFAYNVQQAAAYSVVFTATLLVIIGAFNHYVDISEVLGGI